MTIDKAFNLYVYQYDYGIPVVFTAKRDKGFLVNDQIVFVFNTHALQEKTFTVDSESFSFEFALTEREAQQLYACLKDKEKEQVIPYSIKHYRNGVFVDTLKNATLNVRWTVPWQN